MHLKNWTPKQIKIALMEADVTQQDIATSIERSITNVNLVIHKKTVSDRTRRAIADALGRDVKEIWPEDYLPEAVNQ